MSHQKKGRARLNERLWTWSRMTAWRKMAALIKAAGIPDGPHASPKGFRHGFGVTAVSQGHRAQHGPEMAWSRSAYYHGYLCKRSGRGGAVNRLQDVELREHEEQTHRRIFKSPLPHVLPFESVCTLRRLRQTPYNRRSFQSWLLPRWL